MIVHCPSCSTGYHLAEAERSPRLRCSRCLVAFPCPTHRRSYVLGELDAAPAAAHSRPRAQGPPVSWTMPATPVPTPARLDAAPVPAPPTPAMQDLDAALFAPPAEPAVARRRAGPRAARVEPAVQAGPSGLVPLAVAAAGAASAWFAAPILSDPGLPLGAWIASLPFPVEPWMLGAAGAALGFVLGGLWLKWQAAQR